ncbi:methionine ABC transporter permease [Falsigemmobacter intermedius]|uniref:ABC transporter permease n=1 Tax=Falsigemmobacter intermedius TaxID=1553448 RepID=A0A451GGD3_9RHOB|nr:methionine ABC transporter permease [Falsigemmobacter intermedius]RWY35385.1 ABC transporter permease [Falsigemmobacter intermedius]
MLTSLFPRVRGDQLWQATLDTLYMTGVSGLLTAALGLALGAVLFLTSPGQPLANRVIYRAVSLVVNIGRAIPFIILLVLLIPFTKAVIGTILGVNAALPALIFGTAPFYARLVEIAFREVSRGVIEATRAMGGGMGTILFRVLIPEAAPALVSGMTVTLIALVSYTAMAGAIGAGGLGHLAYLEGFQRNNRQVIFVATAVILVLVFAIQFAGDRLTRHLDKR